MTGHASISADILGSYAADAALEVAGVQALVPSQLLRHRGVRVDGGDGAVRVELHVAVAWGASVPELGAEVDRRVREYLARMADVESVDVHVIVDEVAPP